MSRTVQLVGIGRCRAKAASEIAPGDLIIYNYGQRGLVVTIQQVTPKTLAITTRYAPMSSGRSMPQDDDPTWTKRYRASTLVAYIERPRPSHVAPCCPPLPWCHRRGHRAQAAGREACEAI
jgi:hypothetical protein